MECSMVVSEQGCRLAADDCVWISHTAVATALDLNGPALEQRDYEFWVNGVR